MQLATSNFQPQCKKRGIHLKEFKLKIFKIKFKKIHKPFKLVPFTALVKRSKKENSLSDNTLFTKGLWALNPLLCLEGLSTVVNSRQAWIPAPQSFTICHIHIKIGLPLDFSVLNYQYYESTSKNEHLQLIILTNNRSWQIPLPEAREM